MDNDKEIEFYLKNAYRALLALLKCLPEGKIAPQELAVYDYLTGEYCYVVFSNKQEEIYLRIYPNEKSFVSYLESKRNPDDFYAESTLIAQDYIVIYFMLEDRLNHAAKELYHEYAFEWRGYWPLFCWRKAGKTEKILWDKDMLISLTGVLERLTEMLSQKSWADDYLLKNNSAKEANLSESIVLWDYQGELGWQKRNLALSEIYAKLEPIEYEDTFLMKRIAHKPADESIYEMSWFYIPIEQNIGYNSYYPLYANLVNLDDGLVLFSMLGNPQQGEKYLIEALAQNIAKQEKKPGYIVTADYSLWRYLDDFCAKCGINLRLIEQGIIKDRISEGFHYMLINTDKTEAAEKKAEKIDSIDSIDSSTPNIIVDLKSYRQKYDKS